MDTSCLNSVKEMSDQEKNQRFIESLNLKQIKCRQRNIGKYTCFTKDCKQNPFMCSSKKCSCNVRHLRCFRIQVDQFAQKIYHNKSLFSKLMTSYQKQVNMFKQNIINLVNKIFQQSSKELNKQYKNVQMTPQQCQIFNYFQDRLYNNLNGNMFNKVFQKAQQQNKLTDNLYKEIHNQRRMYSNLQIQIKSKLEEVQFKQISKQFIDSNIINKIYQVQNIKKWFDKKINKFSLLYSAQANNFNLQNFYLKCDNIPNTLVLIKTQFGKKVGGFTSKPWSKNLQQKAIFISDQTFSTFIFSLTQNQKYKQRNKQGGIFVRKNKGPIFGMQSSSEELIDIQIQDFSNIKESIIQIRGYAFTSISYYRSKPFNGSQKKQCKILDWEVWNVEFEQQINKQPMLINQ